MVSLYKVGGSHLKKSDQFVEELLACFSYSIVGI